jgi:hypothetical protein
MGGGGSQTIEQTFNLSAVNKSIFEQVTTNTQKVSASSTNIQSIGLNVKGSMIGCPFTANQKIKSETQTDAAMATETILAMKNEITTEMQAGASAAIEKSTEAGNMQFGDKQNVKQETNMAIENIVDTTITTENLSEVISNAVNIQENVMNIGGDLDCQGEQMVLGQDISAKLITKAVMGALTDALIENKTTSKLTATSDAKQKTENKGLADIVGTFFEGITGPIKYALIACVIMICVVIIGLTLFLLSPAGQNSTRTIANAGAKKLGGPF